MSKIVLFKTIQFCIQKLFPFKQSILAQVRSLNVKTVLFQAIQFSINMQFSFIRPMDRVLSGATTLGQSGLCSDNNERILRLPQSSSITGSSPSDCLVSYPGHYLGGVLPLCREAVGVFYSPSRQGIIAFKKMNSAVGNTVKLKRL